jgi:hypothetical protein
VSDSDLRQTPESFNQEASHSICRKQGTESAAALEDGPLSVAAELGAKFDFDGPC